MIHQLDLGFIDPILLGAPPGMHYEIAYVLSHAVIGEELYRSVDFERVLEVGRAMPELGGRMVISGRATGRLVMGRENGLR